MTQFRCRRGFTMLELLLSGGLTLGLLLYLGDLWKQLPSWTRRLSGRACIVTEERLARAFLLSDLERAFSFDSHGPSVLIVRLSAEDPQVRVEYSLQDGCLRRTSWPDGSCFTVSAHVEELSCQANADGSASVIATLQSGGVLRELSVQALPL